VPILPIKGWCRSYFQGSAFLGLAKMPAAKGFLGWSVIVEPGPVARLCCLRFPVDQGAPGMIGLRKTFCKPSVDFRWVYRIQEVWLGYPRAAFSLSNVYSQLGARAAASYRKLAIGFLELPIRGMGRISRGPSLNPAILFRAR
jgi:hypothetical protein